MDKIKAHLDKAAAVAIILVCVVVIARTHLSQRAAEVSNEEVERVIGQVQKAAHGLPEDAKVVPDYASSLVENMKRTEKPLPAALASWKLYAPPDHKTGPVIPRNYTVLVQRLGPGEQAAAEALVRKLKGERFLDAFVHGVPATSGGGFLVCMSEFVSPNDAESAAALARLAAAGYAETRVIRKGVVEALSQGAVAVPSVKISGIYVGETRISAVFNAADSNFSSHLLQIWRKKAGDKDWPDAPLVTLKVSEGGQVSVNPPDGTQASSGGVLIIEKKLPPREAYEYRARAAATFGRTVRMPEGLEEKDVPGQGKGYFTGMSAPVTVETAGEVQIQFIGKVALDGKIYGNFKFKRYLAGGKHVEKIDRVEMGTRIQTVLTARIDGRPQHLAIDSEANLVGTDTEMRQTWVEKTIMVRDKDGFLVAKKVRERGLDRKVDLAIIEDLRTNKTHRLDKPGFDEGDKHWWPVGLAIQTAPPAEAPPPAAASPRPSAGAPGTTPKTTTPGPVVTPEPVRPPSDPSKTAGAPKDPGLAPRRDDTDPTWQARYEAWKTQKEEYDRYMYDKFGIKPKGLE